MRGRGGHRPDPVTGSDDPFTHHYSHDPGLADEIPLVVPIEDRSHETSLKAVQLPARIAQAGHLDDGVTSDVEVGAGRKREQVDIPGRDVLTHLARFHAESGGSKLVEQLGLDQVHLAKIGLGRILGDSGPMLDVLTQVGVSFYSESCQETDRWTVVLAEGVALVRGDGGDSWWHGSGRA